MFCFFLFDFIFGERKRTPAGRNCWRRRSLGVEIDSRKMLSWGEKGRESAERNRMKQGRVALN